MCIVFGNMPHDIQSLEVYDSTFPTINPNIESQVNSQYLKITIHVESAPKYRDSIKSGDKNIVPALTYTYR